MAGNHAEIVMYSNIYLMPDEITPIVGYQLSAKRPETLANVIRCFVPISAIPLGYHRVCGDFSFI